MFHWQALFSPESQKLATSYEAELTQISNLKRRGLLDDNRAEKRLDAADSRYEDAQKTRAVEKATERTRMDDGASSSEEEAPVKQSRKKTQKGQHGQSRQSGSKSTTPASKSTTVSKRKGGKTMSLTDQMGEFRKRIHESKSVVHYKTAEADEVKTLVVDNAYIDKTGAKCTVWKPVRQFGCMEDDDLESESAEDGDNSEQQNMDVTSYECCVCARGSKHKNQSARVSIKDKSLDQINGYLRNHRDWCERQHDILQGLLPLPENADAWVKYADVPSKQKRAKRKRGNYESEDPPAAEDPLLEDSAVMDADGR